MQIVERAERLGRAHPKTPRSELTLTIAGCTPLKHSKYHALNRISLILIFREKIIHRNESFENSGYGV
jgi:hypothetical protein